MKKVVLFIVALMSVLTINAGTKKSVKLSFDKQQFSFVKNSVGAVRVVSHSINGCYASDVSQPGLPLFAVNVGVPNGVNLGGVSTTCNKQLIYNDVIVAANSVPVHTGCTNEPSKETIVISSAVDNRQQTYNLPKDNPIVTADVTTFSSGVLTVSLFANGQLVDSRNITK